MSWYDDNGLNYPTSNVRVLHHVSTVCSTLSARSGFLPTLGMGKRRF